MASARLQVGGAVIMATKRKAPLRKMLPGYLAVTSHPLLLPKQIPDTCERVPQFRIGPGNDLSRDNVSCRERGPRGIRTRRKVFRFDSAAQ